jgi:hypothetical protein
MGMLSVLLEGCPCNSALNNKIIVFDMLFKLRFSLSPTPPLLHMWETLTLKAGLFLFHQRRAICLRFEEGKELSQDTLIHTN